MNGPAANLDVPSNQRQDLRTPILHTRVKICGLKDPAALNAALDAGADYIGLVFFPPSPRNLSITAGRELAARIKGRAASVALLVDASDALIDEVVAAVRPEFLQLHGLESPERVRAVKARTGLKAMKAIKVGTMADLAEAAAYVGRADMILFDAKPPKGADRPGGHGAAFDWALVAGFSAAPWMLSGGLNPANVAAAIAASGTREVDVSSGVESAPGVKDIELIRRFIAAARGAG